MAGEGTVSRQNALLIIGGVVALVVLIAVLAGGGDDDGPSAIDFDIDGAGDSTTSTSTTSTVEPTAGTGVASIDCRSLIDPLSAPRALEADDPEGRIISSLTFAQGERCEHTDTAEPGNYVVIEPGTIDDFAAGATRLGVTGEPVEGIGQVAIWFGADDVGSLTVAEESELGTVLLRVEFGRVAISDELRRLRATELAMEALLRMPGIDWTPADPPVPVEITTDLTPAGDPVPRLDHVGLLLELDESERTDALIATLRYYGGDDDAVGALPTDQPHLRDQTAFVAFARSYAEDLDEETADEVLALLDALRPPAEGTLVNQGIVRTSDATSQTTLTLAAEEVSDDELPEEAPDGDCPSWFELACRQTYGPIGSGNADDHQLWGPALDETPVGGVTADLIEQVRTAMGNAIAVLEPLGTMPDIRILLFPDDQANGITSELEDPGLCDLSFSADSFTTETQAASDRQVIAIELSRCFLHANIARDWTQNDWAHVATMYYLGTLAEPDGGLEEVFLSSVAEAERNEPVEGRGYTNTMFLLQMHAAAGPEAVLDLVDATRQAQDRATAAQLLADHPGFGQQLFDFTRDVTDLALVDGRGDRYGSQNFEATEIELQEHSTNLLVARRNRGGRGIIDVPAGMKACVSFGASDGITVGWRLVDDEPGSWDASPPDELEGSWYVVATTTDEVADATLNVGAIVDVGDSCEPEQNAPNPIVPEPCLSTCQPSDFFSDVDMPTFE